MERKPVDRDPAPDTSEHKKPHASEHEKDEAAGKKTQFDGNPNPEGAPDDLFGPRDDTPLILEKKEKPRGS